MSEWFHVGQKVVCVESDWDGDPDQYPESQPEQGRVYTIRSIERDARGLWLRFEEVVNPCYKYCDGTDEVAFNADSFRPLRKRTTSIEVFTQLLNSKPKELERT